MASGGDLSLESGGLKRLQRRVLLSQVALVVLFAWGITPLLLFATVLMNPAQRWWAVLCIFLEPLALGIPVIWRQPIFRRISRHVQQIADGRRLSPEQAAEYERLVLAYPLKVGMIAVAGSVLGYGLAALVMREMARLPWEGVIVLLMLGAMSGVLWSVVAYFSIEYLIQPLTGLAISSAHIDSRRFRIPLWAKIFASGLAVMTASLGFFGLASYSRAAEIVERGVGKRMFQRMRDEHAPQIATTIMPDGKISENWRTMATDVIPSPDGYVVLLYADGRILETYPPERQGDATHLSDIALSDAARELVLGELEGYTIDRLGFSKIIAFTRIPDSSWKLMGIAPRSDFNEQLTYFLKWGLAAIAFAFLLSLGIGALAARSITTPLAAVTRAAQLVAEERDLSQRVPFFTNDEVGVLSGAFNQMAEALQDYARGLEHLVDQRTAELRQRSEQLVAKNNELNDFIYVVSHDLRAPLINIEGFSRALQEAVGTLEELVPEAARGNDGELQERWPELREDIAESLDFILRGVSKMDMLAKGLLDLSRIETRSQIPQTIHTEKVVDEVLGAVGYQISQKGIDVRVDPLPDLQGDPFRIHQVFGNLIDNAIKYMDTNGERRIHVGCEKDGTFWRFFVADTGPGIRPQDQVKIFRIFTRLGTSGPAGDGIGLAAVRKIIEKHGGSVGVESDVGQGSTFWFTLPRHSPEAGAEEGE